jgi:excisionase family DNA binding protein
LAAVAPAREPRRKSGMLRPETAAALSEVLASILVTAAERAAEGDYLLTVAQVAARWGVCQMAVRNLIYQGRLRVVQFGTAVRVRACHADEFARANEGAWRKPLRRVS